MVDRAPRPRGNLTPLPVTTTVVSSRWLGFPGVQPPLIGRDTDLAELEMLVSDPAVRLVSVTGAGGVGKTRLAIATAQAVREAFPAGAVFVSLASVRDHALVISALARALNVPEAAERPLLDGVLAALREQRVLLLLDNFEHVLPAASLITDLLDRLPRLTVLVTSRAPLGLATEHRFQLQPLALPPTGIDLDPVALLDFGSVALFAERARWAQPGFTLASANVRAVSDICRRLDGVPLAIELASAWMRVVGAEELQRLLDPSLPLLRSRGAELPDRQRTMHDTIAWSYALLTADEARLFRTLGVFVGGFTFDAALAVWEAVGLGTDAGTLLDLLASLVDKSLLRATLESGGSRLRMLETVREFALDRLTTDGEEQQAAAAHAAQMVVFSEAAEPHLLGPDEVLWRERCEAELGNLRAALTWTLEHDSVAALRISAPLWLFWNWYRVEEGRAWTRRALDRAQEQGGIPTRTLARAYTTHAALCGLVGDVPGILRFGDVAVALAAETGERALEGLARWVFTVRLLLTADLAQLAADLDLALPLMHAGASTTVRAQTAYATSHRGIAAIAADDSAAGMMLYEEALGRARDAGSQSMLLVILGDFAGWCVEFGDLVRARELATEALGLAQDESLWVVGSPLSCLALLAATNGDERLAARILGAVDAGFRDTGLQAPPHFVQRLDRARDLASVRLGHEYSRFYQEGLANPRLVLAEVVAHSEQSSPRFSSASTSGGLSPRQRDVLRLLVSGRSDRQIAEELYISHRTVSNHVAAIMTKLGTSSRSETAVRAVREGII